MSKWLIRKKSGQIVGPLSTADVIQSIQGSQVTEEDKIALYPGADWIPISHNPEFYDVLLDVLSGASSSESFVKAELAKEEKLAEEKLKAQKAQAKNVDPQKEKAKEKAKAAEQFKESAKKSSKQDLDVEDIYFEPSKQAPRPKPVKEDVIELKSVEKEVKKQKAKSLRFAGVVLVLVALLVFKAIFFSEETSDRRIRLLGPKQFREMSREEIQGGFNQAIQAFNQDTLKGYLSAQNKFVQVVEGNPKGVAQMGMLCLTYLELWPFSFQDTQDIATIGKVVQRAKKIDPAGPDGNTCRVVELLTRSKTDEADATTEGVLTSFVNAAQPPVVFYYFKTLNLERSLNFQSALGYVSSLQRLWPQWLKPYVLEARLQEKLGDFNAAATRLKQVIGANPQHKEAFLRLGIIEYKKFFRYEEGVQNIKRGAAIKDGVSQRLLSDAFMVLAEHALKSNDNSNALKYAQKAYESFSGNQAAKNLLVQLGGNTKLKDTKLSADALVEEGRLFEREGDCNSAQAHYKAAYERNVHNGTAALLAAKCLWKLSFSTEAIEWLNKAVVADPNLIDAYLTLADYYSQRYNFEAAGIILQKASRISKNNYEVFRAYARAEYKRRNYSGAVAMAKQTLALNESDVETNILLAQALLKERSFSDAYGFANKAVELDPNNRSAHVIFARTMATVQGIEAGLDYMNKLIQQFPLVSEYRMALAEMLVDDERYQAAREIYLQVIEIDKDRKPKEALLGLALTEKALGNYKEAVELLFDAAVMDAADPTPLYEAGVLFLSLNKPSDALVQFERVRRINPLFPLVHYYLGKSALLSGNPAKALEMVDEERKINPKLPEPFLLAAEAYAQQGQFSLCAREYQSAIQLQPQGALIYVKLASCYRRAGELDIASKMLSQAATIESGLPDIYREQGQVYETKGDRVRALEAYDQYLVLNPQAPDAAQVRQQMSNLRR